VPGVWIGSIRSQLRMNRGREVLSRVGIVEWRTVIGRRVGGQERLGRDLREGRRARGVEDVGVKIKLREVSTYRLIQ
jgi:hypothetical protein